MNFDARVVGIAEYVKLVKGRLGRDDAAFAEQKFEAARKRLSDKRPELKAALAGVFKQKSEPVAHIYCERFGFLSPLQTWATARDGTTPELVQKDNAWTDYLHLAMLGANDALIVPLDFPAPYEIEVEQRTFPLPVCSAVRLDQELERANKTLKVEKAFRFPNVPDFMMARREQVRKLEKVEDLDDAFWVKFGLVSLRHLVKKSLEHKLPVIFADQSLEPVEKAQR